jgi:hypothetical protein
MSSRDRTVAGSGPALDASIRAVSSSLILAWCLALCHGAAAQEETAAQGGAAAAQGGAAAAETGDLARQAQNPLASLVSLPLQANYNRGVGEDDRTMFNLNIQPVVPFDRGKYTIITRAIIPVNSVPVDTSGSVFGIGDSTLTMFFSPKSSGNLTWGFGPVIGVPTASNPEVLGSEQWSLGPSGVIFYSLGSWTMGFVASNLWSIAGNDERSNINLFTLQYFFNYNFGRGWAVGTAPILTANWEAESGEQWTIPFGVQVSKVTSFGSQPVNLLIGAYNNAKHPTGGAERQFRVQINFLFPQG